MYRNESATQRNIRLLREKQKRQEKRAKETAEKRQLRQLHRAKYRLESLKRRAREQIPREENSIMMKIMYLKFLDKIRAEERFINDLKGRMERDASMPRYKGLFTTKKSTNEQNRIKREEGPSSSQVNDERELEVEIQVKQEINDDPLSLAQVKEEPIDDSEDTDDWEPSEKTRRTENTRDNGVPSSKIIEISIKNEYDEALMIDENEVRSDIKHEKE